MPDGEQAPAWRVRRGRMITHNARAGMSPLSSAAAVGLTKSGLWCEQRWLRGHGFQIPRRDRGGSAPEELEAACRLIAWLGLGPACARLHRTPRQILRAFTEDCGAAVRRAPDVLAKALADMEPLVASGPAKALLDGELAFASAADELGVGMHTLARSVQLEATHAIAAGRKGAAADSAAHALRPRLRELSMPEPKDDPPNEMETLRSILADNRRARVAFETAWRRARFAALELVPAHDSPLLRAALGATKGAWQRAYFEQPATVADRAAAALVGILGERSHDSQATS